MGACFNELIQQLLKFHPDMWVADLRDSAVLRLAPAASNSSVYANTCMTVCIGIRHDEKVSLHSLYNLLLKLHGYYQNA